MTLANPPSDVPQSAPQEADERVQLELHYLAHNAKLKGQPSGQERCGNCRYYLEPEERLSYCWHVKLRILVDGDWWCQWWRPE